MIPETNLQKLLANMMPELHSGEYVFASVKVDDSKIAQDAVVGWFREPEGITVILERSAATEAGIESSFPSRMITLTIHSSLEAVGFMAVITKRLAAAGISVNAISAYLHDHLFV
ncbi:MAG: ACT domain-containing protein, partial [Anaerolineales bacterium]